MPPETIPTNKMRLVKLFGAGSRCAFLRGVSLLQSENVTFFARVLGLLICTSIYYAFYLMNFDEGSIQGSHYWLYIAKSLALIFLFIGFSPYKMRAELPGLLQGYVIFSALCFSSYIFASFIYNGSGDDLYFNQLIFVPFSLLLFKTCIEDPIVKTMDIITAILLIQLPICTILDAMGYSLWLNRAYVGGMGNPNSFGVCVVVCLTYIWTLRPRNKWNALISFILITGGFLTQSLLVACLLWLVPAILYILHRNYRKFIYHELQVTALYVGCFAVGMVPHLTRKILALFSKFGFVDYSGELGSLLGREQQLNEARHVLSGYGLLSSSFFPVHNNGGLIYTPADCQYLSLILSFGIMAAIIFMGLNFLYLYKALTVNPKYRAFLFAALAVFNIAFLANRILDYFPMGFFYILILASIFRYQRQTEMAPPNPGLRL